MRRYCRWRRQKQRIIYTANNLTCWDSGPPKDRPSQDVAQMKPMTAWAPLDFYQQIYGRNSIDDKG
jgi:hypothetical protein